MIREGRCQLPRSQIAKWIPLGDGPEIALLLAHSFLRDRRHIHNRFSFATKSEKFLHAQASRRISIQMITLIARFRLCQ